MYSSTFPCPLPIKSLTSILKAAKVSGLLLLRDSLDPLVNTSVPHLKVGEWKVEDVVKQGEDKIEFEKVLGYHPHNRAGLGFIKQTEVPPKQTHDYRKLVSDKVNEINACGSLNCSFIMTYVMLTTLSGRRAVFRKSCAVTCSRRLDQVV